MKKPFIIHPFLFAVFPILFFITHNISELWGIGRGFVIMRLIAITIGVLLFAVLLWILLRYAFRDWYRAGILFSLFLLMFFSYGHFNELIQKLSYKITFEVPGFKIQTPYFYFLIWIIIFFWFIYLFKRKNNNFFTFTRFWVGRALRNVV